MKKFLTIILSIICISCFGLFLAGCNNEEESSNKDEQIFGVYNIYVAYAKENGQTPLSYEDWLASIKGEKGEAGKDGKDGATIKTIEFDEQGRMLVVLTDGTVLGPVELPKKEIGYTENLNFEKISGKNEYRLLGLGSTYEIDIVIPPTYNGMPVTEIDNSAFRDCVSLTSIAIPNSVQSIGFYAFWGCSSLQSVTIDNSVQSIGDYAFCGCSELTSVTIGNSVQSIGDYAFYSCSSLTSIEIPNSVQSIGNYVFSGCSSLTSIEIPNSVQSIGDCAFWGCSSLTSIKIPNSITSIGERAFCRCDSLTSVVIPNSVTSIGSSAFSGCSSLESVIFNDTSTWYRTNDSTDWENKTGGTQTSVANALTNATYFKSTYNDYYWYKL